MKFQSKLTSRALFFVLIIFSVACQQTHDEYTIKGSIKGLNEFSKVYIQVLTDTGFCYIDSTDIQNTEFILKGRLDEPIVVTLWIKDKTKLKLTPLCNSFYLENSIITAKGDIKNRGQIKIEGSKAEKISKGMIRASSMPLKFFKVFDKVNNSNQLDSVIKWKAELDLLRLEHKKVLFEAIKKNASSFVSLHILLGNLSTFSFEEIKELAGYFPKEMHSSRSYKSLIAVIENKPQIEVGEQFREFALLDSTQNKITRTNFKCKVLMIDFWASWCGPCRRQLKPLKKIYTQTSRTDFDIMGVSLDENIDDWKQALVQEKLPWINTLSLGKGWVKANFLITSIPYNFLLDSHGVILAKNLSIEEIDTFVNNYCSKKHSPKK